MTIHEIEERTGMARANIRYYERVGLLAPCRSGNNYRDYSEDDLAALQKIRLLRQLRIPVSDIARLQSGEAELLTLLAGQAERLLSESGELAEAAALCRELIDAQEGYSTLDAEAWLRRIEAPAVPRRWQPFRRDRLPAALCPWKRFFARGFDWFLCYTVFTIVTLLFLRRPFAGNLLAATLLYARSYGGHLGLVVPWFDCVGNWLWPFAILALAEPLLLSVSGTTPGKWLFGLRVTAPDGKKLTYWQGLRRIWGVFLRGYGCGIPLYCLWRLWRSYRTCAADDTLPWERASVCESEAGGRRWYLLFPGCAACLLLSVAAIFMAYLPVHTGELTLPQLLENCNVYIGQHRANYGLELREDGYLIDKKTGEPSTWNIWGNDPPLRYRFKVGHGGVVTAVSLDYEHHGEHETTPGLPGVYDEIISFGYHAAVNRVSIMDVLRSPWMLDPNLFAHNYSRAPDGSFDKNDSWVVGRVRVTNTYEESGYYAEYLGQEIPLEGENQYIRWTFTLELVDGR